MLGNRNNVGASDFGNNDLTLVGGSEINVVRSDTSGDAELELFSLRDAFASDVTRVERGGDDDLEAEVLAVHVFDRERVRSGKIPRHQQFPCRAYCSPPPCRR